MRKALLASLLLLLFALSAFLLADRRQAQAAFEPLASTNVVRDVLSADARISTSYRFANAVGFLFLAGAAVVFIVDRHMRQRE